MSPICQEFLCSPYDISCNLHNHLIKYGYFHLTDEKPNIKAVQKVSKGHIYKYLVQFNSVMSDLLRPQGLHHTRPPRPTPIPRVYSDSCPLSWWCHSTISPSIVPFSSCPQCFPESGSFPVSWAFTSGAQAIGASAPVLLMIQGWFHLGLTGLISLLSKRLSRLFSSNTVQNHQFSTQSSLWSNSHIHTWLLETP